CCACEVSVGTACGCATTIPAGAVGLESCPSGVTIGGSGACPGTWARNGAAGATTGGGAAGGWVGGRHPPPPGGGAEAGGGGSGAGRGAGGRRGRGPARRGRARRGPPGGRSRATPRRPVCCGRTATAGAQDSLLLG